MLPSAQLKSTLFVVKHRRAGRCLSAGACIFLKERGGAVWPAAAGPSYAAPRHAIPRRAPR